MVNITLDREVTFDLPEGTYTAQITGIKPFNKQSARVDRTGFAYSLKPTSPNSRISIVGLAGTSCSLSSLVLISATS